MSTTRGNSIHILTAVAGAFVIAIASPTRACDHAHTCAHTRSFDKALDIVAARDCDPDLARERIFIHLRDSRFCYDADLDQQQWEVILQKYAGQPVGGAHRPELRFVTRPVVWVDQAQQGVAERAQAAHLTYSFPADGVTWGSTLVSPTGPNVLNAQFATTFGANNIDRGREYVRQGLAGWRRVCGLTYNEVADDDTTMTLDLPPVAARGDIRIGGLSFGENGVLAYNMYTDEGGDMTINTSYFIPTQFSKTDNDYRKFRNTVAHEHGHGLAYRHSVPCNDTKLLEPFVPDAFDLLSTDDIRAAVRNYGDRFAGNNAPETARDFGNLTSPSLRSVIERTLATNGSGGYADTHHDWFRFTLGSEQPVTITVDPVGGSYSIGAQVGASCGGTTSTVNADQAGDLTLELYDASGTMLITSAAAGGPGVTESIAFGALAAGTYTVRVVDVGPNPAAAQIVQLYDLMIRVDTALAPPAPIAGLNKRAIANMPTWFNGAANSRTTEVGATLSNASYDWDLDGDGVFEAASQNQPRPIFIYPSNGVYNATLRLTDSNGVSATDTITVTITGGFTELTAVAPATGIQGQAVPVTITGTNLKNVTSASMVTVLGGGVSVTGTPTPNALGTQVTGLSFVIAPGAAAGSREVRVANGDGEYSDFLFTVEAGSPGACCIGAACTVVPPPSCGGTFHGPGSVCGPTPGNPTTCCPANFDQVNGVDVADLFAYINAWLAKC